MRIIVIIQHATSTNLLLWWWWRRNRFVECVDCVDLLQINLLQSQLTPSINIIAFMSRFAALKAKNGNFYCPLMIFFAFKFLSLWIVTIADADSSLFLWNLLLTYVKFTQLWKILLNEFTSQSNVFYQSDINDLNCNNLKFTTAYLTDWLPVWVHWTQFFK